MLGSGTRSNPPLAVIITRSPLRITFGGGGTDLPSYYERHGGFLIAAAIDKYVYVIVSPNGRGSLQISSSDYSTFFRHSGEEEVASCARLVWKRR